MTESKYRNWDIIFKFLTGLGAIVTFLYGIEKFEISSRRDFAKEFYKEEILFYNELVSITSNLANSLITDSLKNVLIIKFDVIYNGKKDYFVKDKELLSSIRKYNDAVTFIRNKEPVFSDNESTYERANRYAKIIGVQSRKNIDRIINQLKATYED